MRRWIKGVALGLLTGAVGTIVALTPLGSALETNTGLTWLFGLRGAVEAPNEVSVVAINNQTAEDLNLPGSPRDWPRSIHGKLVDALVERGASTIVFDMFFQTPKVEAEDQAFVDAVERSNRVILVQMLNGRKQPVQDMSGLITGFVWIEELLPPLPALEQTARGMAPFPLPKVDAAVYEFWTFKSSVGDAPTMPAMALQFHALDEYDDWMTALEQARGQLPAELPRTAAEITGAAQLRQAMRSLRRLFEAEPGLAEQVAALHQSGSSSGARSELRDALASLYRGNPHRYINFYGPPGTITNVPYQSVLKGVDPNLPEGALDFTGKVVFVGASDLYDPGQPDRFYTVFTRKDGVDLSGVEIAATAFANLLTDAALHTGGLLDTMALVFGFGFLLAALIYFVPAAISIPVALALAAGYVWTGSWLFGSRQLWLPMAVPMLLQLPMALLLGLLGQYLFERRRSKHISEAITYYLPENVARELSHSRLDPSATNKVVYSTCFATDMAGFSTLAETLPPDKLASFLNDYFEALAQPLKNHKVDVTEFRADAIMCAWTAPKADMRIRQNAVDAALEAVDAVEAFKASRESFGTKVRIGLECGTVYVGHAGGGGHFVYSIVGDCANTASRIESLNKHLGTRLMATAQVVEGFEESLLLRPLGKFQFVGKTEGLPIVEILARKEDATPEQKFLCDEFAAALATFQQGQWTEAGEQFADILRIAADDGPAEFFRARCERHARGEAVPEDYTVVRMEAK